jgi:uncharacterized membrane protein YfcA
MVWPLTWVVVIGTVPGVLVGTVVRVRYLPDPRTFKLFVGMVLLYIGARMVRDLLGRSIEDKESSEQRFGRLVQEYRVRAENEPGANLPTVRMTHVDFKRISYEFYGEHFDVSVWAVLCLCAVVGIIGGVYGIGGGAIIAPFFVSVLGLPVYTVAGAALMGTFVTSIAAVGFYQAIAPFYPDMSVAPDWTLGFLFGLGGMVGIYLGARCQKYVPARAIKWMLVSVILFTGVKYLFGL